MQVYRTFLKMLMRNIASGLLYLGIFIIISLTVAKNSESNDFTTFNNAKLDIAVIDRDNSTLSKALYDYLNDCQNIISIDSDEKKWADELFYRTVDYILVIDEGFEEHVRDENYDNLLTSYSAPDSNTSYIAQSQTESFVQNVCLYLEAGYDYEQAALKAGEISRITADVQISNGSGTDAEVSSVSYFFTFLPYVLICMLINSLGATLMAWNRPEIKARTAVSGTGLTARNAGIIAAMTVYSLVIVGIFIIVCIFSYRKDFFSESTIYYGINGLCYMFVCIAITFLVAQLSKRVSALSMWSNVIGLSTSFLCGVFVTKQLLPDKVVAFSKCLPTYWYINVTEELKYFSGTLSREAWISMGVQLLFAAAIFAVSLVIIKNRQQKNA